MWKDAKYLLAYVAPLAAVLGIQWGGWWSPGALYVAFVMIPVLELVLPKSTENLTQAEEAKKGTDFFFDILLYLNIPILYGVLFFFFHTITTTSLSSGELFWMTLNVGVLVGTIGINVAHELGHRQTTYEQQMAKTLLLAALYMHFFIEHNRGHHRNVATDEDSASARKGESLYAFWFRSVFGSYFSAWKLEAERLQRLQLPAFHWRNAMIWYQLIQVSYLLGLGLYFGWAILPYAIGAAVFGFLLLETVNYIEHYGLRRRRLASGRYEKVSPEHSWNSDHELGRIFLYELTRHSDHHFKATRKYQVLRRFEESPQLPLGYPGSMLLSLVPPLWFRRMNKEVDRYAAAKEE
ncbi:MAG: alkane 1-monooxygenase [Bacteroidota bacterium]